MKTIKEDIKEIYSKEDVAKRMDRARSEMPLKTKNHLETFNDGILAILITIMVLEIPVPSANVSYQMFIRSIFVFLVSFFVVANFWYGLHREFLTFDKADHWVIISDFIFLAVLSLIPVTTKWIISNRSSLAVINYGVVYMISTVMMHVIMFCGHRTHFKAYRAYFVRAMLTNFIIVILINAVLIAIAVYRPRLAFYLYLALPIISFFAPGPKISSFIVKNMRKKNHRRN